MALPLERLVRIPVDQTHIEGLLALPAAPTGLVLFAHGSGSSRHSPRNNYVAGVLHARGVGTLLLDLLTPEEDRDYRTRFDIALLTQRLIQAALWLGLQPLCQSMPLGYFGASTGAAAALMAAAAQGPAIQAVVSRGGRPDLAGPEALARVACPTLLLVGGRAHALPAPPERGAGRHPFVRGAGHPGGRGAAGRRLVRDISAASRDRLSRAGLQGRSRAITSSSSTWAKSR